MAIVMTLWIGNGGRNYLGIRGRNYLIFKILLIAIDWNF